MHCGLVKCRSGQKPSPGMSFAKHTSMSHVAGYGAAFFNTMGSPAYTAPPRTLQKCRSPPTEQA